MSSPRSKTRHATRPTPVTPKLLARWPLPQLDGTLGKEERGRVLVVGGSDEIPGGVLLAGLAALRAGAGKLQLATARSIAPAMAIAVPEARVIGLALARSGELARASWRTVRDEIERCDALLVGPGMSAPAAGVEMVGHFLRCGSRATLVVDAAPLVAWSGKKRLPRPAAGEVILTPHAGEMANLSGIARDEVLARPLEIARAVSARIGAVVVLKGADTYIALPDGSSFVHAADNPGLGTSGSGDVLAGVIAGVAARGATAAQAAVWGVLLHARAGAELCRQLGPVGFLARELLAEIPALLDHLSPQGKPRR